MRAIIIFCLMLALSSCGGMKKSMKEPLPSPVQAEEPVPIPEPEPVIPEPVIAEPPVEPPIKEVVEKLVPVMETPPAPDQYFVIIGSFRNYNNAVNYQGMIKKEGFTSVLLKNEKGLHRVSVLGTNNITEARNEIKRIRTTFPKYGDVWLLVQLK